MLGKGRRFHFVVFSGVESPPTLILKKSKKVIISRNLIEKNLSVLKYQYLMKFFTLSSNNSENSLFFSIDNQSLTLNSEYLPFLSEILLGKDLINSKLTSKIKTAFK